MNQGQFARVCVFCGSCSGKKAVYTETAEQLGAELVRRGIDLVYGGGSIGLMGTVANAVQDAGGHVVGVIPKALMPKEICGNTVGDLVAVDNMHQRKAEMARRANAFIALPGGFGTLEEVLEIITWAQLGIHKKPVGLLNVDGYYDAMLALFDKALEEEFLNLASHNIVVSATTAAELLDKLQRYEPTVDKTVPELSWETTTGVSETPNYNTAATNGTRASKAPAIKTRLSTPNGVTGGVGAGWGSLLLRTFRLPRSGRFSAHSHIDSSPIRFHGFTRSLRINAALTVCNSAGAGVSVGAPVVLM